MSEVSLQHEQIVGHAHHVIICVSCVSQRGEGTPIIQATALVSRFEWSESNQDLLAGFLTVSQTYFKFQQIAQGWCQDGAGCVNQVQSTRIMLRL